MKVTTWKLTKLPRPLLQFIIIGILCTPLGILYYYWTHTPLEPYILDVLGIRSYFLPDLSCENCNNFSVVWSLPNSKACEGETPVFLLIAVVSYHVNANARKAIRQTWGSVKEYDNKRIMILFFFGTHEDHNFNSLLFKENQKHGDIVQANFKEAYRALTNKTMMMLQWVNKYCPSAQFVLKTDDDSFNIPQNFVSFLANMDGLQTLFVGGYCFTVIPDRRVSSKFFVGEETYPTVYYPTYCSGPGYVLSNRAITAILHVAHNVKFIPMEDVFTTGACRSVANIQYTNIKGCIISRDDINLCSASSWAKNSHNVVPEFQIDIWENQVKHRSFFKHCVLQWVWQYLLPTSILIICIFICRHLTKNVLIKAKR